MKQVRCDLAVEAREMLSEQHGESYVIPGIEVTETEVASGIRLTKVEVLSKEGANQIGKEIGTYITLEIPDGCYNSQTVYEKVCKTCAETLQGLTDKFLHTPQESVLVVGLGNRNITADALGPKTLNSVMITRHLKEYMPKEIDERIRPVCGVIPGVLGLTGVETGEIVKGITERVKPSLVIVIDALCARKIARIGRTIQFCDTGITPGEGVGNKRNGIKEEVLGVPVIAIGVPTVVDAATIADESIHNVILKVKEYTPKESKLYRVLEDLQNTERYELVKESIQPVFGNFIVAPKEADTQVQDIAKVIANGINIALHEGITLNDIDRYR